jgi:hypothetical protein
MRPMPSEALLNAKSGDLVVVHCDTLHSTCVNVAPQARHFISTYLVPFGDPPPIDNVGNTAFKPMRS